MEFNHSHELAATAVKLSLNCIYWLLFTYIGFSKRLTQTEG